MKQKKSKSNYTLSKANTMISQQPAIESYIEDNSEFDSSSFSQFREDGDQPRSFYKKLGTSQKNLIFGSSTSHYSQQSDSPIKNSDDETKQFSSQDIQKKRDEIDQQGQDCRVQSFECLSRSLQKINTQRKIQANRKSTYEQQLQLSQQQQSINAEKSENIEDFDYFGEDEHQVAEKMSQLQEQYASETKFIQTITEKSSIIYQTYQNQ
eukprot:TRINITY_DN1633_c0_g1_i6.p1 TRINITY_DN1633_c0_g1~~TRINITY_DN1633_c0_g1_i6.p1  ORF type:complete len:209 (-),score=33.88 TRINITY_DN1633_c0_g1_i6:44-670(-)